MREDRIQENFEKIFKENYSRLYYYALDWVNDEEVAKDIVSSLFSDLWMQHSQWEPDNIKAYTNRAIHNRCLNYLKHKMVEKSTLQTYLEEKKTAIFPDVSDQEELMDCVEEIMNSLPPKTRFIVEQCYIEGKKYSELAALMDISPGMVHKHISKALAIFRKTLKEKKVLKSK